VEEVLEAAGTATSPGGGNYGGGNGGDGASIIPVFGPAQPWYIIDGYQDGYFGGGGGGGPAPPYPPSAKGQGGRGGGTPFNPAPAPHLNSPGPIANSGAGGGGGADPAGGRSGGPGQVVVKEAGGAPGVWSLQSQFDAQKSGTWPT
jgi:hypothetical protein